MLQLSLEKLKSNGAKAHIQEQVNDLTTDKKLAVPCEMLENASMQSIFNSLRTYLFALLKGKNLFIHRIKEAGYTEKTNEYHEAVAGKEASDRLSNSSLLYVMEFKHSPSETLTYVSRVKVHGVQELELTPYYNTNMAPYDEIMSEGLEYTLARCRMGNNDIFPLISVSTYISRGSTTVSIDSHYSPKPRNAAITRMHLGHYPVINKSTYLPAHCDLEQSKDSQPEGDLQNAILINSDAHNPQEFCKASFIEESPHDKTYIDRRVYIIRLEPLKVNEQYRNQLFRFFINNENIRTQLPFYWENGGRMLLSIKTLQKLWVPARNTQNEVYDQETVNKMRRCSHTRAVGYKKIARADSQQAKFLNKLIPHDRLLYQKKHKTRSYIS